MPRWLRPAGLFVPFSGLASLICSIYVLAMPDRLADYPYFIVRLGCRKCFRKGQYRLARLAARYGEYMRMGELRAFLVGECWLWKRQRPWNSQICGAYFIDLESPRPPDLPADMRAFKLMTGGKK